MGRKQPTPELLDTEAPSSQRRKGPGCFYRLLGAMGGAVSFLFVLGTLQLLAIFVLGWMDPESLLQYLLLMAGIGAIVGFFFPGDIVEFFLHKLVRFLFKLFE